jgi:hypothetical protein
MQCKTCNSPVRTLDGGKPEGGIRCPECNNVFCDNCYDTGKGDGCHCHKPVPPA